MRKLLTLLAFSALLVAPRAFAQSQANPFDPCAQFPKQYVGINISSATTTRLVALNANAPIYVCGGVLNQVNGTGSLKLEYGTGATCGTGTTALTGPLYASTVASGTTNVVLTASKTTGTYAVAPTGTSLCAVSTGTIQQSGWLSYVQSPNVTAASFFDPCSQYPMSVAPINFSAATGAQLIAGVSSANIYVCGMYYQDAGRATTANTGQFSYGTGSVCATGTTNIGGVITGGLTAGANATTIDVPPASTMFTVPMGDALCLTPTQTSTITGYVDYVQR